MLALRRSKDRGYASHGWLESYHSFSFADYHDPKHMHYSRLRVLNDDRIAPGMGFGTHPHRDMEIVTYLLHGSLEHQDSMGNGSVIDNGDVQRMSAGSGITHSEFNPSQTVPVHLLQIWILPDQHNLTPEYEQKHYSRDDKKGKLCPIVSPDGREGSLTLHQDVVIYASILGEDDALQYVFAHERKGYLHVATGEMVVNGHLLREGDGLRIADVDKIALASAHEAEFLLFDLP
ncbi:MAG: pirin family protein [Ferrovum sp.]|nr:pirin family protein [Ferrovum sp.]NDU87143.1 pirin family protein [Ferrovum sp.]